MGQSILQCYQVRILRTRRIDRVNCLYPSPAPRKVKRCFLRILLTKTFYITKKITKQNSPNFQLISLATALCTTSYKERNDDLPAADPGEDLDP